MRVLIPNHFPLQGSGSGIYTLNLALELQKQGHAVEVLAPDHEEATGYPFKVRTILFNGEQFTPNAGADLACDFNFPCFTTHPRSSTTFYELTSAQRAKYLEVWQTELAQAAAEFRPDIIHAHHVWVTGHAARATGIPYVITVHGTDLMGFEQGADWRDIALSAAGGARAAIAISREIRDRTISTYGLDSSRVHLIWNGFAADIFRVIGDLDHSAERRALDVPEAAPLISFVGKFTDFKGIDVLLDAAALYEAELPDAVTLIVGEGSLRPQLEEQVQRLDLRGVRFLGHQKQERVAALFNLADVSVVPSRVEPFGLVAVEALACGTPVVATNAGGLPDFINDQVGALVPVGDAAALAAAILDSIRNSAKQEKGAYAAEYALNNFAWGPQIAKMAALYEQVLEQPAA